MPPPIRQNIVFRKIGLASGSHTLKMVVRSDRDAASNYVVVDAIGIL